MKYSYIYMQMSEAFTKLRKAKDLEIEAILQMQGAEREDILNENFKDDLKSNCSDLCEEKEIDKRDYRRRLRATIKSLEEADK